MGIYLSCSHPRVEVLNIEPDTYKSSDNVWIIQAGDGKCKDCGDNTRVIKKVCVDHGIHQPWEKTDIHICQHEHLTIKNKIKDIVQNKYDGRMECVFCKIDTPVYCTFTMQKKNGILTEILTSDWTSNKKQLAYEMQLNQNKINK